MNALPGSGARPAREDFQRAMDSRDTDIDVTGDDLMALSRRAEQQAFLRDRRMLTVASVMSHPLLTVSPETTLSKAAHMLVSHRISGLPVINEAGVLAGILTEADFLRALGLPSDQPAHRVWQTLELLFKALAHHGELKAPDDAVALHMTSHVVTIHKEQQIAYAIGRMKQHHVKRVVVCDEKGFALGMITRSDLVRVFFDTFIRKV